MNQFKLRSSRRATLAILAATLTASAAGAATLHRFGITQTTGSEGAQTVLQNSATSSALQGEVSSSSPNTKVKYPFGVLGEYDASGSTFGIGTLGISTTGYAVAGESLSNQPAVLGYAGGQGAGVQGISNITGESTEPGISGIANGYGDGGDFSAGQYGYGVFAISNGTALGTVSEANNGGAAYLGLKTGEGVAAYGYSGTASDPALTATAIVGGSDLLGTFSYGFTDEPESFIVQSGSANRSGNPASYEGASDVQVSGDLYVYGKVYQSCLGFPATSSTDCQDVATTGSYGNSGVTRSASGNDVKVYAPTQGVRTVEDFGEAQLVNGRAYVRLDSAFARTTAPGSPYLVFLTPGGDSRGVFMSNRTAAGFEVHENAGGRTTMPVEYRIVAKPLGDTSQRFVVVAPRPHPRIPGYNVKHYARDSKPRLPFNLRQKIVPPLALTH